MGLNGGGAYLLSEEIGSRRGLCVCLCECVRERIRERERECVCVYVCVERGVGIILSLH